MTARRDLRYAFAAVVAFGALSVTCGLTSEGFLTADALEHYLYARYALHEPYLLVDVWGRPFVTALYALPAAALGRQGVHLVSLLCATACAVAAWHAARGQGVCRPVFALLFTLAQPLVFLNSFSEMTELPFAMLLGLAFLGYQARRWRVAAALVGLMPLARPEGFGLLALAGVAFLGKGRVGPLLILPMPLLLWNHAGWELYGRAGAWWRWLPEHWPYAAQSTYPSGHVLQFVAMLPVVVGPLVLPATLIGIVRSFRVDGDEDRHARACRVVTAVIPVSILVVHSLLYWLGKLASYGEPRYLLVAAPLWAVLSARGWEWASSRLGLRRPLGWAVAATVLPAAALWAHPVLPLRPPAHWARAKAFASAYREQFRARGYPRVMAAHPAVFYFLDVSQTNGAAVVEWRRENVAAAPPGTVLLWDPIYSPRNAHGDRAVGLDEVVGHGWVLVPGLDEVLAGVTVDDRRPTPDPAEALAMDGGWHVFLSPARNAPGRAIH